MIKKILLIAGMLILAASIWIYFNRSEIMLTLITDYEPFTFESVLDDPIMRAEYGIGSNSRPEDYGFTSQEIEFESLDKTQLSGWYINNNDQSDHCILFAHGRTSNRLKPMKYLALIDSLMLDTLYNVFIPDLRNSGRSTPAKTYMGYKFGEDLVAAMLLLSEQYQQKRFILYGFSMGAMAALNVVGRDDLQELLKQQNLEVDQLILDSPLANVRATLERAVKDNSMASALFEDVYGLYSSQISNFGENMKLSSLLPAKQAALVLQGKNDQMTISAIVEDEIRDLKSHKLKAIYFEGAGHVKLFQDSRTRAKYISDVRDFLLSSRNN